jgi:acyl-homoserine-lactone acylase
MKAERFARIMCPGLLVMGFLLFTACSPVDEPPAQEPGQAQAPKQAQKQNEATVTIYRDDFGVPHIYADQEESGLYGLGYAQAEDQLARLLGGIYLAHGRLAELEGESRLATDIELRRWRHVEAGLKGLERLDPQLRKNYDSFVAGVDRYLADHPDRKPAWALPFGAADLVALNRAIFWLGYASVLGPAECQAGVELQAGIRDFSEQAPRGASNGWALSPSRTASGSTILLADPHVEMQNPVYYEYRLHAGELDSAGYSLGPMLWQAHNRHVSWAMTTGNPDLWDCYEVEVDPENPTRYLFDGEWHEMVQQEEIFQVREGEPVTMTFEYTRHNGVLSPVVARRENKAYVVSVSQMNDAGVLDNEIYWMNQAESISELQEAMSMLGMFPQNIIAGDSSGNIWYLRAGKTPIRPAGYDWTRPVPGNDSKTAWQGFYSLDEMVQLLNPPQGFLQNNNVAPDVMFAADNIQASDFPAVLFNDTPGRITTRGMRSIEVLSAAQNFSIEDAREHAFDETWITARPWLKALAYALEQYPQWLDEHSGEATDLVRRLMAWNGEAVADSVAALNFFYWHSDMAEVLQRPGFEQLQTLPWNNEDFSPAFAAAILEQAERAAAKMVEAFASTDVAMGSVFRIGRGEQSWPLGGETIADAEMTACVADLSPLCDRTMRAFSSGPAGDQGQRRAYRGSNSMRLVEFSDPLRSWSLHVHGQSDDPASPHYDDQTRLMSQREFKPVYFNRQELENHIESTLVLDIGDQDE